MVAEKSSARAWESMFDWAIGIVLVNRDFATMLTFTVAMSTERLLTARTKNEEELRKAEQLFTRAIEAFKKPNPSQSMLDWFKMTPITSTAKITDADLRLMANSWLA